MVFQWRWIFITIITLILMIIIILIFKCVYNQNDTGKYSTTTCFCAFDIDNTLICRKDNGIMTSNGAKNAIDECRKRGCKIGFITARSTRYYDDIPLTELGLSKFDLDDFYYRKPMNEKGYSIPFDEKVAESKVNNLKV